MESSSNVIINCEINLIWSASCVICEADRATTFGITDIKFYVPVVTLSTQDNSSLLQQLNSGFKQTIYWYKFLSKVKKKTQSQYLDCLADPSFQGVTKFLFYYLILMQI